MTFSFLLVVSSLSNGENMYVLFLYERMCVCGVEVGELLFCILYLNLKYSLKSLKHVLTF